MYYMYRAKYFHNAGLIFLISCLLCSSIQKLWPLKYLENGQLFQDYLLKTMKFSSLYFLSDLRWALNNGQKVRIEGNIGNRVEL